MECDADASCLRNDALSQSYAQGVARVAQQSNVPGFNFELPKEVLEEREKVWDELFDKYEDEVSDEIDLNINTMEPVQTEEAEEDEEEEEEHEEYYSKCRAPMRKLPALIQYWIDTGNPPYQLDGEDDHSETGSSLSEGEHSRSGQSAVIRESNDKHKNNENSPYSSVDTNAYILSNTNVTKKAETIALVEGAKSDEPAQEKELDAIGNGQKERIPEIVNLVNDNSDKSDDKNKSPTSRDMIDRDQRLFVKDTQKSSVPTSILRIVLEAEQAPVIDPLNNLQVAVCTKESPSKLNQSSVKLSEVLPALQQFDDILEKSRNVDKTKSQKTLELRKVRRKNKPVVVSNEILTPELSSSLNLTVLSNGVKKPQNRRKLYTGRDSPVDLTVARTSTDITVSSKLNWHPALEPFDTRKTKDKSFSNRARARRKRKRILKYTDASSQDGNTSQDSDTPIVKDNSKGNMRYTDFFESLGLTPSKTIIGKTRVGRPLAKRLRRTEKRSDTEKTKETVKQNDALDNTTNDAVDTTQTTKDSDFSPASHVPNPETLDVQEKIPVKISNEKDARVEIVRLTQKILDQYRRPDELSEESEDEHSRVVIKPETRSLSVSSSLSDEKKRDTNREENVELLTNNAHDSDSSTILFCECDDVKDSDSDVSLFTSKKWIVKKKVNKPIEQKLSASTNDESNRNSAGLGENAVELKINSVESSETKENNPEETSPKRVDARSNKIEDSDKVTDEKFATSRKLFIRVQKLPVNDLPKTPETPRKIEKSEKSTLSESPVGETSSPKKRSVSNDRNEKIDSSPKIRDKFIRTGSCVTGESRKIRKSEKLEKSENRFRDNIEFSDEEENFEELVRNIGSKQRSTKVKNLYVRNESNSTEKDKIITDDLDKDIIDKDDGIRPNGKLNESNRRKMLNIGKTASKDDAEEKSKVRESQEREQTRKSTRLKHHPTWGDNNVANEEIKNSKPKRTNATRNLFSTSPESNLSDEEFCPLQDYRESKIKDENSNTKSDLQNISLAEASQSLINLFIKRRVGRPKKNSCGSGLKSAINLARFRTRMDSDSDTEFETSKYTLKNRKNRSIRKTQSIGNELTSTNKLEESDKNTSMIRDAKLMRMASDSEGEFAKSKFSLKKKKNQSIRKMRSIGTELTTTNRPKVSVKKSSNIQVAKSRRTATDSEAEFETSKFSINDKINRSIKKTQSIGTEVTTMNGARVSNKKIPTLQVAKPIRTASDSEAEFETYKFSFNNKKNRSTQELTLRNGTKVFDEKMPTIQNSKSICTASDSEAKFEKLKNSVKKTKNRSSQKMQSKNTELRTTTNDKMEVFHKKSPTMEDSKWTRTSPRFSLKNSSEGRRSRISKTKLSQRRILFEDSPNSSEKLFSCKIEATDTKASTNNRLPLRNDSVTSVASTDAKKSTKKRKNTSFNADSLKKRKLKKKSSKSEKTSTSLGSQRKSDSRASKATRQSKRRTRILGTPINDDSDDDNQSIEYEFNVSDEKQRNKQSLMNGNDESSNNRTSIKRTSENKNSAKNLRSKSKNLFSNNPDDTIEDSPLIFNRKSESRVLHTSVVIENLNFTSPKKKYENLINNRQSTMSFRTRIRSDSDDDNVL